MNLNLVYSVLEYFYIKNYNVIHIMYVAKWSQL